MVQVFRHRLLFILLALVHTLWGYDELAKIKIGTVEEQVALVRAAIKHNTSLIPAAYALLRMSIHQRLAAKTTLQEGIAKVTGLKQHLLQGQPLTWQSLVEASVTYAAFNEPSDWWYTQALVQRALPQMISDDLDLIFETFADDPMFNHLTHSALFHPHDPQAVQQALQENMSMAARLLALPEPSFGHAVPELFKTLTAGQDKRSMNTCRHTLLLTFLFRTLVQDGQGQKVESGSLSFVEIGSGYGNMIRLVAETSGFRSWVSIDLPLSVLLQEYYLDNTLPDDIALIMYKHDDDPQKDQIDSQFGEIPSSLAAKKHNEKIAGVYGPGYALDEDDPEFLPVKETDLDVTEEVGEKEAESGDKESAEERVVTLVKTSNFNEFVFEFTRADVLIATHSWSELALDSWFGYYNAFLGQHPKVDYILYAYQRAWPSEKENKQKRSVLESSFKVINELATEEGKTVILVLKRRKDRL
eukprot:gb/GEZN01006284.1/.p1 GENE.gb/GEZN01006284.1/~~gb/GEZN01006284.1/.p1  ORF type:complete len:472 (-),score=72.05 gb/GEZN01006284.1/:238-1653(-)